MKRQRFRLVLFSLVWVLILPLIVSACEADGFGGVVTEPEVSVEEGAAVETALIGVNDAEGILVRASTLLDFTISNPAGEDIGEVADILIDMQTGNILFVTFQYGTSFTIGDSAVPVPLRTLNWGSENNLILNVAEERLAALPEIDTNWPDIVDTTWEDEIVNFWVNEGIDPGFAAADTQVVMNLSGLIGYTLIEAGLGAESAIEIDNMLVNLSQGYAPYVIVDYGGLLNDNLVAVPFDAFNVTIEGGQFGFALTVDLDTLQNAPLIEQASFEEASLFSADFADEITSYWEEAGYEVSAVEGTDEQR
ncbi:MAG: PRC-barrel domain-containing protein [Caldilineaceae bacterium]